MNVKIAVVVMLLAPALAGARDLEPGTIELSGSTGLNFADLTLEETGEEDVDIQTFEIDATAQYYVFRNFGIGLSVSYSRDEEEQGGDTDERTTSIFGPAATFNFPVAPAVNLFVRGSVGRMTIEVNDVDADGYAIVAGGGVRFFPADWVSFDGTLQYDFATVEDDAGNDIDLSGFDLGVGISVYFGGPRR